MGVYNTRNYSIIKNENYFCLQPIENKYDYSIFFFGGFTSYPQYYIKGLLEFIEKISDSSNIKFKVILPILDKYPKESIVYFRPFNKNLIFTNYIYSWFNYEFENNICLKYKTNKEKDDLIKKLIQDEINILGSEEKLIFVGHSMGGRYILHIIEEMQIIPSY